MLSGLHLDRIGGSIPVGIDGSGGPGFTGYHKIHFISILFGFVLLIGFVKFIAASISLKERDQKGHLTAAIIYTSIYGTLAGFNYIVNSSYIHHVFEAYPEIVEILTMNNPKSICWPIEMYSYGFLGLATYTIAPVFRSSKVIVNMLKINRMLSIAGALATFFRLSWVLSPVGMIAYFGWNLLNMLMKCWNRLLIKELYDYEKLDYLFVFGLLDRSCSSDSIGFQFQSGGRIDSGGFPGLEAEGDQRDQQYQ